MVFHDYVQQFRVMHRWLYSKCVMQVKYVCVCVCMYCVCVCLDVCTLYEPSTSSSLWMPRCCSARLKAFCRLWWALDFFSLSKSIRSGLCLWRMALKAMPSLQLVLKLWMFTLGYLENRYKNIHWVYKTLRKLARSMTDWPGESRWKLWSLIDVTC